MVVKKYFPKEISISLAFVFFDTADVEVYSYFLFVRNIKYLCKL